MKKIGIVFALLALTGLAVLNWALPSQAAVTVNVITVTTTDDTMTVDNECSLREAIHNVNIEGFFNPSIGECAAGSSTLPNVIVLESDAVYNLTILGAGDNEGDLDIHNDVRFETTSLGKALIVMTVGGQRVMEVHGVTVELDNISLMGGSHPDSGGGIYNNSGNLTLTNVNVQDNLANAGGGLYNHNGTVLIRDNTQIILNGGTLGGGGIYNNGELTISNSLVRANNSSGGSGGGVYNDGGTLLIQANGAVNLNSAASYGGGIYNDNGGTVTIHNSLVESNTATIDGGGAFSTGESSLTLHNSVVKSNTASSGGGIHSDFGLTLSKSQIVDNIATYCGGGIHLSDIGCPQVNLILGKSQIIDRIITDSDSGNRSYLAESGGVHQISQTLIADNETDGVSSSGAGIFVSQQLIISNSTISNNTNAGTGGGGLHIAAGGDVVATNITVASNSLDLYKANQGELTLQNSIISTPDQPNCIVIATAINSLGHNVSDDTSCGGLTEPTDLVNTDPLLEPLADNGGNTLTHNLQDGSPAMGHGNAAACAAAPVNGVDQRGVPRLSSSCDSGAVQTGIDVLFLPLITRQ